MSAAVTPTPTRFHVIVRPAPVDLAGLQPAGTAKPLPGRADEVRGEARLGRREVARAGHSLTVPVLGRHDVPVIARHSSAGVATARGSRPGLDAAGASDQGERVARLDRLNGRPGHDVRAQRVADDDAARADLHDGQPEEQPGPREARGAEDAPARQLGEAVLPADRRERAADEHDGEDAQRDARPGAQRALDGQFGVHATILTEPPVGPTNASTL